MEYRVNLILQIYNIDRSNHLSAHKEVTLPFVPYVGLYIQEKGLHPLTFKEVTWLSEENWFICIVEEEGHYNFGLKDDLDELIDTLDILRNAKKNGWDGFDKIFSDK